MLKELSKSEVKWVRPLLFSSALIFLVAFSSSVSWAVEKPYPDKPINMVLPFSPGSPGDLGSRFLVERMSEFLGQPIISVYKPGGGGSLAASFVAKSKPDGYTMLNGSTSPVIVSSILRKVDYRYDDFIQLGIYAFNPNRISVKAESAWKTLKDFVEEAKKSPGKLMVASYGKYSVSHFVIEKFTKEAKISLNHVPYKGASEALTALMGGHADAAVTVGLGGFTDSPLLRVLAVCGDKRLEDRPEIPTFGEYGYPVDYVGYYFFAFPKGTPKEIVDKWADAQKKIHERYGKEIREGLKKFELLPVMPDVAEGARRLKKSYDDVFRIATELGIVGKE